MTDTGRPDPNDPDLQDELVEDIELEAAQDGAADEELHLVEDDDADIVEEDHDGAEQA